MTEQGHVRKAVEALERGEIPRTKKYLAGYYFNDAMIRVDIAYENLLRRITQLKSDERAEDLVNAAVDAKVIDRTQCDAWLKIRDEVNDLKHRNPEQIARHRRGHGVSMKIIISALTKLVALVDGRVPKP